LISWKAFSRSFPELASKGEELINQFGVGLSFLATVRKDGAPRLHPVCPVFSDERLYVLVLPSSPKRWDLKRDGRYAMQSFPEAKPDSDEFYLSGKAREIKDTNVRAAVLADAKHHASEDEYLFELLLDRVMHTQWEGFGTEDYRPIQIKWRYEG
jgi:nitroimidazol reductase NimA-like FMN-containing flavoprotein (pyridoxamine 5'-phosphate oxidase superfamily)